MDPAEQKARDLATDYQQTFASPQGQRVLADLSARYREHEPAFIPGLEHWQPAFRDGARSVVRFIRLQLDTKPNTQLTFIVKK